MSFLDNGGFDVGGWEVEQKPEEEEWEFGRCPNAFTGQTVDHLNFSVQENGDWMCSFFYQRTMYDVQFNPDGTFHSLYWQDQEDDEKVLGPFSMADLSGHQQEIIFGIEEFVKTLSGGQNWDVEMKNDYFKMMCEIDGKYIGPAHMPSVVLKALEGWNEDLEKQVRDLKDQVYKLEHGHRSKGE